MWTVLKGQISTQKEKEGVNGTWNLHVNIMYVDSSESTDQYPKRKRRCLWDVGRENGKSREAPEKNQLSQEMKEELPIN